MLKADKFLKNIIYNINHDKFSGTKQKEIKKYTMTTN